jgi:cobalamin biosynthesis protein CbiD
MMQSSLAVVQRTANSAAAAAAAAAAACGASQVKKEVAVPTPVSPRC